MKRDFKEFLKQFEECLNQYDITLLKHFLERYRCLTTINGISLNFSYRGEPRGNLYNYNTLLWQNTNLNTFFKGDILKYLEVQSYQKMFYDAYVITEQGSKEVDYISHGASFDIVFRSPEVCNIFKQFLIQNGIEVNILKRS